MKPGHKFDVEWAFSPRGRSFKGKDQRAPLRDGLTACGQYHTNQAAGRFFPVACVSLEVTQRCNMDCTLCYLSDHAEQAYDLPLSILFDRIAMVASHYGRGTSVQISGGDPTLRKLEDLEAICGEIRRHGLRSCLMTNGVRATRDMLKRLADAGLDDVAFHVDLTLEHRGYDSEAALNSLRETFIERAKGLGLRILFNTTVYDGNVAELPDIAAFFQAHADDIALASFQLQADTGRGTAAERDRGLTRDRVKSLLGQGFGTTLEPNVGIGHSECNQYDVLAIAGGQSISLFRNSGLIAEIIEALEANDRSTLSIPLFRPMLWRAILRNPLLSLRSVGFGLATLWKLRRGLIRSRGRVARLSVLVHSFMDAKALVAERCESCVFMVMTADGPMSMCAFNAERDTRLFQPVPIHENGATKWWSAATGDVTDAPVATMPTPAPAKNLKGRLRAKARAQK